MVTVNNILGTRDADKGEAEFEFKGLSTDLKPTGVFGGSKVGENSLFLELDTGDAYYLNGGSWKLYSSGEGGGSGAGLPAVTSEDNGKVLGVVNGEWGVKADETGDPLPAVTSADNGKVLGVVNGAWGKTDLPAEALLVTASVDFGNGTVTNLSHTAQQIYEAVTAGKVVIGRFGFQFNGATARIDMLIQTVVENAVIFSRAVDDGSVYCVNIIGPDVDCGIEHIIPEYDDQTDVGKVLSIDSSGELAWISLT